MVKIYFRYILKIETAATTQLISKNRKKNQNNQDLGTNFVIFWHLEVGLIDHWSDDFDIFIFIFFDGLYVMTFDGIYVMRRSLHRRIQNQIIRTTWNLS